MRHKSFDIKNPNKLRSVLGTFQRENILLFHAQDSSGYEFVSQQISIIDKKNPQAAARLILPLTRFKNYNESRKNKIKKVLKNIIDKRNPQAAARLILPLTRFRNYNVSRKNKIKKVLKNIINNNPSNDLTEIIEKALD